MIPKIIHYCWFGRNPMSEVIVSCTESWKRFFPDFEFRLWNEDNFDVDVIKFTSQAYKKKKYAFVADYARLCALEKYGGVFFDTDMEFIKGIDDLMGSESFLGFEEDNILSMGTIGCVPGTGWVSELKKYYENKPFIRWNGRLNRTPITIIIARMLEKKGVNLDDSTSYQNYGSLRIFPRDYFSPRDYKTGNLTLTKNSRCIHHFAGSWK